MGVRVKFSGMSVQTLNMHSQFSLVGGYGGDHPKKGVPTDGHCVGLCMIIII